MTAPVLVLLTESGFDLARSLAEDVLPGARIHGYAPRIRGADESFEAAGDHLRALFVAGTPIVGICAAGVLIRTLAPLLADKRAEPPVVAVAEDGSAVVPLLGGHHGANDLARRIAAHLGIAAAVTTAGDVSFGVALDAPPLAWRLANPEHAKNFMAQLLSGKSVRLDGDAPFLAKSGIRFSPDGELRITVTAEDVPGAEGHLVYHPRALALGLGCERGTAPEEAIGLAWRTLDANGLSPKSVAGIFSLDLKSDEPAVHAVAAAFAVPARFFDADTLERETRRLETPSEAVFREVGCHGVAEGAALAAAGPDARLVVPKAKSARATCAVAQAPKAFDGAAVGRARGWLGVVGTGPGAAETLTPEAKAMVARATDLVGYGLYIDLLGPLAAGKTRHDYALGEEEARVVVALDLAAQGRAVALVSSGDPGIYAMATLVFELIDRFARPGWGRVEVAVAPGISALQAASARVGAVLGHDFCTISLSDLMTPWSAIEARLRAAAEGDFVVAFYNPRSRRRDWQLVEARRILLEKRPPETPVVVARNLGRDGEAVTVTTLGDLDPATVDMLSVVLVGSSQTRALLRGDGSVNVYTPRGYGSCGAPKKEQ